VIQDNQWITITSNLLNGKFQLLLEITAIIMSNQKKLNIYIQKIIITGDNKRDIPTKGFNHLGKIIFTVNFPLGRIV